MAVMALDIVEIGHPVLHQVATEVDAEDLAGDAVQNFIDSLIETKRVANGAGIAANQVNNTWRIFIVEVGDNPRYPYKPNYPLTVLVNPVVTFLSDERFSNYEGCLSIPNLRGRVERCPEVRVQGLDRKGNKLDFEVRGVTAGTFQHEMDHLDGILYTDKVSDTRSLCTWDNFRVHHEEPFGNEVRQLVERFGS